ncbi:MAG TPA: heparan-alpha-glucosaminide N-acetyltransferase domain-containing protein, partial [Anaerolineae bacterium]|nr:heparan-alpha-glucosaminide N-acetyltransferase domain-containing protein [Anaerolineae bacterium]
MEQDRPAVPRLWEMDAIRGVAVLLMIGYHFMFDLSFFGVDVGDMDSTPWKLVARGIGTTFILLLGIALTLRYHRLT